MIKKWGIRRVTIQLEEKTWIKKKTKNNFLFF